MPKIVVKRKEEIYKEFLIRPFQSRILIGSEGDNDLIISDKKISLHQLIVLKEGTQYFIGEIDTNFDTLLNGKKVTEKSKIVSGDEIVLGEHVLIFENTLFENNTVISEPEPAGKKKKYPKIKDRKKSETEIVAKTESTAPESNQELTEEKTECADPIETEEKVVSIQELEQIEKIDDEKNEGGFETEKAPAELGRHYLIVIHGPYLGKKYPLNFGVTRIGRDKTLNDILICETPDGEVDSSISRRHATIVFDDNNYFLMDKRSKTRTRLNKRELKEDDLLQLSPNDEIEIISDQVSTIFRFMPQSSKNFSRPQKSGYWWLRNQRRLGKAVSFFSLFVFVLLIFHSFGKLMIIRQQPDPLQFNESIFYQEKNGNEILLSIAEVVASSAGLCPATADLNGDDYLDLVYLDKIGYLKVIDGRTKQDMWKILKQYRTHSNIGFVLADMNGDDQADVIFPSASSKIYALDGKTGAEIWSSPILGGNFSGAPLVVDFNGDKFPDVFVCCLSGQVHLGYGQIGDPLWKSFDAGVEITNSPSTIDINNDELPEIIFATADGKIQIYDDKINDFLTTININEEFQKIKGSFFENHTIKQKIVAGKLNADNFQDILLLTEQRHLLAFDLHGKKGIWTDSFVDKIDSATLASPILADLDNDQQLEAIVVTGGSKVIVYDGAGDGSGKRKIKWGFAPINNEQFVALPVLADINKDNYNDVLMTDFNHGIYIFDGFSGQTIYKTDSVLTEMEANIAAPLVADFNNDCWLDILYRKNNDAFYALKTNNRIFHGAVFVGQPNLTFAQNGFFSNAVLYRNLFYSILFASIIGLILIVYLNFRSAMNWKKHFQTV